MDKVIKKDFRKAKEFILPVSGVKVEVYSSLLVGDASVEVDEKLPKFDRDLATIIKSIKKWNLFASETDEKPLPITVENMKSIPATDFEFLMNGYMEFVAEQKKSTQN